MTIRRYAFLLKVPVVPGMSRFMVRERLRQLIENAYRDGGTGSYDISIQRHSDADEHEPPAPQSSQSER